MKVGDRYIIEIEEVIRRNGAPQIARIKGFNALVFDKYGLEKLEPYENARKEVYLEGYTAGYGDGKSVVTNEYEEKHNSDLDYKDGLEDGRMEAWECARKIYKMTASEIITVFGGCSNWVDYSVDEAIAKIKEYEDKQTDEIRVGDEVRVGATPKDCLEPTFVVLCIDKDRVDLMSSAGGYSVLANYDGCYKTGRHFPQIAEVLEQMKGEA